MAGWTAGAAFGGTVGLHGRNMPTPSGTRPIAAGIGWDGNSGGTVFFDDGNISGDNDARPNVASFDIRSTALPMTLPIAMAFEIPDESQSVNVSLVSHVEITGLDMDPAFIADCAGGLFCVNAPRDAAPLYGWLVGGFAPGGFATNRIGTLQVVVPAEIGTFLIESVFDPDLPSKDDPLVGSATIHVTPEPTTLGLLCLGALACVTRRHRSFTEPRPSESGR